MDYLYENLGEDRFQEFCQCLINKEFPNTQAFPVRQPDGGRDSIVYSMTTSKKEFVVYQVKYVRNPNKIQDVHKWLTDTISKEVKKINKLIPKGAKEYYLLTNVKGTSHLDTGSIDKLNKVLEENIDIPSLCWWRDDLSRKFESDPLFKWSFPEILHGQDILNSVLFQNLNEHKERRENVIRAYLADQYEMDNKVKFRQIDLQNFLLDLFTDIPIRIKKIDKYDKALKRILRTLDNSHYSGIGISEEHLYPFEERDNIGAAEFLLNPLVQNKIERVLLEGGPGQGKSTIAQYICQVHRVRMLNKTDALQQIPNILKNVPLRIPFKIDLRHVALWVENINPYKGTLSDEYFSTTRQKSLESFLVGHLFYHSKIEGFTSSDLVAIFKLSQVLFVFDGFDEIANLSVRKEVINFINDGLNRLSENCKSIQVLITSRPAAFSDAIGFSVSLYPHFELTDISPAKIQEYVEKWIKASNLDKKEATEIKKLVEEKLEMPHLKDLAKNLMQLAILINLLRTKGESLPNKRTALYNSYIELFFDRESEKNTVIRDNRDLIMAIHQYLAWILHSEAEQNKTSGIIQIDELKERLDEYLQKHGHKTDISDIFKVVEERVCAIVSRVQGTFEFEVQPLREFFCAKHLFITAPYSPPGAEKPGTKPERFEAISRNFYWQNVLRFFAGCFDVGELPMITQKLKELANDNLIKFTNYPYILASQLLSDYVFSQSPLDQKDVIEIIIEGINNGRILNQVGVRYTNELISLPNGCGRDELVTACFNQLKKFPPSDYVSELIGLIVNNSCKTVERWVEYTSNIKGEQLTTWLDHTISLRIIDKIDQATLIKIVKKEDAEITQRMQILIDGNQLEILDNNSELKEHVFKEVLNGTIYNMSHFINTGYSLHFLTLCFHPYLLFRMIKKIDSNISFLDNINNSLRPYRQINRSISVIKFPINDEIDIKIKKFLDLILPVLNENISNWRKHINPMDTLVENGRNLFGDCWSLSIFAVIAASIKSKEKIIGCNELCDNTKSLCQRVRYARMKAGNVKYWKSQLQKPECLELTLLVFFTWATPKTIGQLFPILSSVVNSLSKDKYLKIANGIKKTSVISSFTKTQIRFIESEIKGNQVSNSVNYLLSFRLSYKNRGKFIHQFINNFSGIMHDALGLKLEYLIIKFFTNSYNKRVLDEVKDIYSNIEKYKERYYYYRGHPTSDSIKIPLDISKSILADCKSYPRVIVILAEKTCRAESNKYLIPVGKIAEDKKWFDNV